MSQPSQTNQNHQPITSQQIEQIQRIVGDIRYGSITLVFQDGRLVQIDRSEKIRVTKNQTG